MINPQILIIKGLVLNLLGSIMLGIESYKYLNTNFKPIYLPLIKNGIRTYKKYERDKNGYLDGPVKFLFQEKRIIFWLFLIALGFLYQIIGYYIN